MNRSFIGQRRSWTNLWAIGLSLSWCLAVPGAEALFGGTDVPFTEDPPWPFSAEEARRRQVETADTLGCQVEKTFDLGAGVNLILVLIPPGKFQMGTPEPKEPDWPVFDRAILKGQIVASLGGGAALFLLLSLVGSWIGQKKIAFKFL